MVLTRKVKKRRKTPSILSVYWKATSGTRGQLAILVAISCITAVVQIGITPLKITQIFEYIQSNQGDKAMTEARWVLLGFTVAAIMMPIRIIYRSWYKYRIRHKLAEEVAGFLRDAEVGEARGALSGSVGGYIRGWGRILDTVTMSGTHFVMGFICSIILLYIKEPAAALVCCAVALCCALIVILTTRSIVERMHILSQAENDELAIYDAMLANSSMRWLVRLLAPAQKKATSNVKKAGRRHTLAVARRQFFFSLVLFGVQGVGLVAITSQLAAGAMSIPVAYLILITAMNLISYFWVLLELSNTVSETLGDATPMAHTMANAPNIHRPACPAISSKAIIRTRGLVKVFIDEKTGERRVLEFPDADLVGSVIKIDGPSGSGKSQFLNMLSSGNCTAGRITVDTMYLIGDEIPPYIDDTGQFDLRAVSSDSWLLSAPQSLDQTAIELRLLFGVDADQELMQIALHAAAFPPSIDLHRLVKNLSGGERSRIFLAAILYQALLRLNGRKDEHGQRHGDSDRLLFVSLDEITGALDAGTAAHVREGVSALLRSYTGLRFIITEHDNAMSILIEDPDRDIVRLR